MGHDYRGVFRRCWNRFCCSLDTSCSRSPTRLFSLFYTLYGSILYVVGPFVLALYPAFGFGQLARTYLVNLMIFNAWGLLYAIFGALDGGHQHEHGQRQCSTSDNFVGAFNGVTGSLLLGLASILLSLCIALIPFLARRIVEGDVGKTMSTVFSTTMFAARGVGSLFKKVTVGGDDGDADNGCPKRRGETSLHAILRA